MRHASHASADSTYLAAGCSTVVVDRSLAWPHGHVPARPVHPAVSVLAARLPAVPPIGRNDISLGDSVAAALGNEGRAPRQMAAPPHAIQSRTPQDRGRLRAAVVVSL